MAEPKTKPTKASVRAFLDSIEDPEKRGDAKAVNKMMQEVTGEKPVMWGDSIVGFGRCRSGSGGSGADWFLTGFSPRKQALSVYLMTGPARHADLLAKLGKHKTGKACLYLKRLADIDQDVLRQLVRTSVEGLRRDAADRAC